MTLLTNAVLLSPTSWTDLGAGPMTVTPHGIDPANVVLAVSALQPPNTVAEGEPLRGARFFNATTHVWALAIGPSARIIVTAPDGGSSSSGSASPGGGYAASGQVPVSGALTATAQTTAFSPLAGRGFNISLWGTFTATIQLERSFDAGTTWLPITAAGTQLYRWSAPASESASDDETGVRYRLDCTYFSSGTINYRISQ